MVQLSLENVKKSFGLNDILTDINFEIRDYEKVGIVGDNGSGKTTLFKIIVGKEELSSGRINRNLNNIGYLEQIPQYEDNLNVSDVIKIAFKKIYDIENKMREMEQKMQDSKSIDDKYLKKYSKLQSEYEMLDGYKTAEKYNRICTGLKLDEEFLNKKFNVLSGGEKTLTLLAKILLEEHSLLLLDEPTNHLDMESIKWLEEYLREYNGAVLIISHDRFFLDRVAEKIIEIDDGKSTIFKGNYTNYVKEKEEMQLKAFAEYKNQQKMIKAMEQAIVRLKEYANASKSPEKFYKRAKAIQKRLDKIERVEKPKEKKNIKLNIIDSDRSSNTILKVKNLSKKLGEKTLLDKASMDIYYKNKVALIGNNGTGKTTLIKMILGEENLDSGKIVLGNNIKIGYLEQQVKFIDEEQTVIDYFRDGYIITEEDARKYLAKYMFYQDAVYKKLNSLSGGERSRIRLAKMIYSNINFLILDEPTNHLDISAIEVLEDSLLNFKGTCLFISHDRYFIDKIANKIVSLNNLKLNVYDGNYSYYLEKSQLEKEIKIVKKEINKCEVEKKTKVKYRSLKDINKDIDKVQNKLEEIENSISELEKEMQENISDYVKLEELVFKKEELEKTQTIFLDKWYELEEESNQISK